jgi:CheY-like chemotaxis protein
VNASSSAGVVLLADDSDDEVLLFKRAFNRAEISNPLQVVSGGSEAIAYLNGEGKFADRTAYPLPRVLVLDVKMPGIDGLQVLQWGARAISRQGASSRHAHEFR